MDLRRLTLLLLLASSCEAGPTSDWPRGDGSENSDDDDSPPQLADAGSAGSLDASIRRDSGGPSDMPDCTGDAGDAGVEDASCVIRDE